MDLVVAVAGRAFTWESATFAIAVAFLAGALAWRYMVVVVAAAIFAAVMQLGDMWIEAFAGAPLTDLIAAAGRCLVRADWQAALFQFVALIYVMSVVYLQKKDWRRLQGR